ncbi:MAG: cytochrome c4 [Leptothrix sp. (in: Bacteria)]|nr:cytochrome c4 [Leptothrix sp. (in: b-proteobacteria)]
MKLLALSTLSAATLALSAGTAFAAGAAPAFKADPAKGQQLAATCVACHPADNNRGAAANPILQGQHADYLVKQLTEFKNGKRKSGIMSVMVAPLSETDMKHIAAFYVARPALAGAATNKDTVTLGESIYRGGIMAKAVPACAGCHSPNGAGIPAQYPRLGGQHVEYTEAQLLAFRSGARGNSAQMTAIAAKMSDAEIKAVADYMAGLH